MTTKDKKHHLKNKVLNKKKPLGKAKKTSPISQKASSTPSKKPLSATSSKSKQSISAKAQPAPKASKGPQNVKPTTSNAPTSKKDLKRQQLDAALKAAMNEEASTEESGEEEFDPAAFFAASGVKGDFRAHIMRKERVDTAVSVRYRLLSTPLITNTDMINLSRGGLCLVTTQVLKPKTVLRIEIPLPHTSELFALQAEVVWSTKTESNIHSGLKFLSMSLAKQSVINSFIQQRRDQIVMTKIGLNTFSDSAPVAGLD